MWDKITCPFPNFNGTTVEVWEWVSNFISHFTGHVITYHSGIKVDRSPILIKGAQIPGVVEILPHGRRVSQSCILNNMAVDNLATRWAWASAAMALPSLSRIIIFSALEGSTDLNKGNHRHSPVFGEIIHRFSYHPTLHKRHCNIANQYLLITWLRQYLNLN